MSWGYRSILGKKTSFYNQRDYAETSMSESAYSNEPGCRSELQRARGAPRNGTAAAKGGWQAARGVSEGLSPCLALSWAGGCRVCSQR